MKNILTLIISFFGCITFINAQSVNYHSFKVDIEAGADLFSQYGALDFSVEPHYRLSDDFAIGLRFQYAVYNPQIIFSSGNSIKYPSLCVTGDYYITKNSFRVFGGGGAGIFSQGGYVTNATGSAQTYQAGHFVAGSENFGFAPRAGFEFKHLRMSVEYNVTGGDKNYSSINIGAFFCGGKKK